jgi:hypothetical protein
VHDVVGTGCISVAVLAERVHIQVATENVPVELQRLPRVVAEADVGVEN